MLKLTPFAVSGLLIAITCLPLFFLTFMRGKTLTAKIYSGHIFAVFWWGIGSFLIGMNSNAEMALPLWKTSYIGVIFVPVFFYHTIFLMIDKKSSKILFFAYIQAIYFLITILSNKMFLDQLYVFHSFYYVKSTFLFSISFTIWLFLVLAAHIEFFRFYLQNKSQNDKNKQILFFIMSLVGFLGGTINFLPFYDLPIYPYGNFSIPIYSIVLAYAILRYQILDVDVVIKKSLIYSLLIAIITIIYLLIVIILEKLFQEFFGYRSILTSIFSAGLIAICVFPLRNKIQRAIDRLFFKGTPSEIARQNELLLQEVAKAEKLKAIATLASGMAHEIKNPLTAIKTFSEYLPKKIDDKEFLLKFAPLLGHEVDRINHLVENLLDFAKPMPIRRQKTDIHSFLMDILQFLNSEMIKNKIAVIYKFSKNAIIMDADPNQLRQAFLNLFLNSIDAMPQGGTLTIETTIEDELSTASNTPSAISNAPSAISPKPDQPSTLSPTPYAIGHPPSAISPNAQPPIPPESPSPTTPPNEPPPPQKIIHITITDTGRGIAPQDIPRIFDPFFSKKDHGTGLGLSITYGIISKHDGKINVKSVVGVGTEVGIEFLLST